MIGCRMVKMVKDLSPCLVNLVNLVNDTLVVTGFTKEAIQCAHLCRMCTQKFEVHNEEKRRSTPS